MHDTDEWLARAARPLGACSLCALPPKGPAHGGGVFAVLLACGYVLT